mmetsp:Transcript_22523/g.70652  ORF Transcript_22523/g.70652 Transcript_22523/m.70652 type:complete len:81 (-) Transcript_22523:166-408(-)
MVSAVPGKSPQNYYDGSQKLSSRRNTTSAALTAAGCPCRRHFRRRFIAAVWIASVSRPLLTVTTDLHVADSIADDATTAG